MTSFDVRDRLNAAGWTTMTDVDHGWRADLTPSDDVHPSLWRTATIVPDAHPNSPAGIERPEHVRLALIAQTMDMRFDGLPAHQAADVARSWIAAATGTPATSAAVVAMRLQSALDDDRPFTVGDHVVSTAWPHERVHTVSDHTRTLSWSNDHGHWRTAAVPVSVCDLALVRPQYRLVAEFEIPLTGDTECRQCTLTAEQTAPTTEA